MFHTLRVVALRRLQAISRNGAKLPTVALAVLACSASHFAAAQDIVRVEEHWELVVASTDSNSTAPQVVTAFSPTGSVDGVHATFEVNHQSAPDFAPGGLHLQVWDGEDLQDTDCHGDDSVMSSGGEVICWTQRIRLEDDRLYFSIRSGTSSTWGDFGGWGQMWRSVETSLNNLNGYNPDVSVSNSGVTYAGNRVTSLVLKSVHRFTADGQELVDDTPRAVQLH
jgi:hypothetical protein